MAYFEPYIDDAGLHIPTYNDIRDDLVAAYRRIYGEDAYLENDSQDYQMISAYALKNYDTMQLLQIVYNNHSPKTAVGTALSSLVKLNGIKRKTSSYSTCVLILTGTPGTTVAAGVAEDTAGHKWDLPKNLTFVAATIEATAQCEDVGAVEALPGTIEKINTPQAGWISVTNRVPAIVGQPVETDDQLRARQTISVAIPGRNMLNSTIAGIASVHGVTRYEVYDNDTSVTDPNGIPGHSIAAVVEGGLDEEVARQIYLRKGPGGGTYGTSSAVFINSDGLPNTIYFSRPTYVPVDVKVRVQKNKGYSMAIPAALKTNLEGYIKALDIGADVSYTGLLTAITAAVDNPSLPPFSLVSLQLGKSGGALGIGDIKIPYNAVAAVGSVIIEEVSG